MVNFHLQRLKAMDSSSASTAIVAVLETAKAACLEIISPVLIATENFGKKKQLLKEKISVLECDLNNA